MSVELIAKTGAVVLWLIMVGALLAAAVSVSGCATVSDSVERIDPDVLRKYVEWGRFLLYEFGLITEGTDLSVVDDLIEMTEIAQALDLILQDGEVTAEEADKLEILYARARQILARYDIHLKVDVHQ